MEVTNMTNDKKKVYILLSKTHTLPSTFIKFMTREPYCHTSLAMDIRLEEMYSFARKGMYNPFNCGFVSENIEKGIFGKHKGTRCALYELEITSKQYDAIQEELGKFKRYPERYGYNYMGVFSVFFNRAMEREYNYFCSQFVAAVLKNAGISITDKEPGLVKPGDFRKCGGLKLIYTGLLSEYRDQLPATFVARNDASEQNTGDIKSQPEAS
jgi:hypothetical protein